MSSLHQEDFNSSQGNVAALEETQHVPAVPHMEAQSTRSGLQEWSRQLFH